MRSIRSTTAAAIAITTVMVAGCAATPADETASIRIGVNAASLQGQYDPATAFIFALDTSGIYESLFFRDPRTFELQPNLAISYELGDDRRTMTVELRDDVSFVGGEPMTAAAVAEFLTLLAADEEASVYPIFTTQYSATFTAIGETTIEVTTAKAIDVPGGFLENFTQTPIADPASMADREAAATTPKGTGPYLIDEVVPQVSAVLVRNPDYWDPERYPFDEVTILAFDDDVARLNALKSGQIDAAPIGLRMADEARAAGFTMNLSAAGRYATLWIADRAGTIVPALADVRVREAISLAFDRETINETLNFGYGVVTSQPGVSTTPEYVPGGEDRYGYDPERARRLMAEAGYSDGFDMTIPITSFLGISDWGPVVQQSLADIGIRVTFDDFPDVGAWFGAGFSGEYPVFLATAESPNVSLNFFAPDAMFNHPTYVDPVTTELWNTVLNGSSEEALEARAEIAAYALDQAWLAVFANTPHLWASRSGFTVNVDNAGFPQLLSFGRAE
jgi:peptide/nickel transport system substrate-binding protein